MGQVIDSGKDAVDAVDGVDVVDQARTGDGGAVAANTAHAPASEEGGTARGMARNAAGHAAGKRAAAAHGWPVDDITGLARRLPEIDPAKYFDGHAKESLEQSLHKWPALARLMKLAPVDPVDPVEAVEAGDDERLDQRIGQERAPHQTASLV